MNMAVQSFPAYTPHPTHMHSHPQHVQHHTRQSNVYSNIQRDAVQIVHRPYAPQQPVQFPPYQPNQPSYPAQRPVQGGFPVYQQPGTPQPYQPAPRLAYPPAASPFPDYQPVPGKGVPSDIANMDPVQGKTRRINFVKKFGEGMNQMGQGAATQLEGAAQTTAGAAKSAVYAPLTGVEVLGRGAIALTGGKATYENGAPSDHFVDGFADAASGFGKVVEGTGQMVAGAGKAAIYTAGAGLQVGARGAGVAAGATAAVAYGAYKGVAWVGRQVEDTWLAQEFVGGFNVIASHKK